MLSPSTTAEKDIAVWIAWIQVLFLFNDFHNDLMLGHLSTSFSFALFVFVFFFSLITKAAIDDSLNLGAAPEKCIFMLRMLSPWWTSKKKDLLFLFIWVHCRGGFSSNLHKIKRHGNKARRMGFGKLDGKEANQCSVTILAFCFLRVLFSSSLVALLLFSFYISLAASDLPLPHPLYIN